MKKIDLGQTISILANVGVIAGIAFLGYEMRQNTAALRSQAVQGILEQIASNSGYLIEDESLIEVFLRGDADPTSLTPIENQRYNAFRDLNFQSWQNMYIQVQEGALDEAVVEGWWQLLRNGYSHLSRRKMAQDRSSSERALLAAISTGRCNTCGKPFCRCLKV